MYQFSTLKFGLDQVFLLFLFFYCNLIDESFRIIKSLARLSILDCISFFFVFHNANGAYRKFIGLKFYGKKIPLKVWTAECFTNALVVFFFVVLYSCACDHPVGSFLLYEKWYRPFSLILITISKIERKKHFFLFYRRRFCFDTRWIYV